MLTKRLEDIDLTDIEALKDNGVAEGHFLDFKASGVGGTYDDRREFLSDVSAFANAWGGDIIYGVTESAGVASGVPGFDLPDPDKEELRLKNLLRDGLEPRLTSGSIRWLPMSATRGVLIVRIPRSWIAPHRVTLQGHDKFYVRDSNGKHPMNVDELRRAFTFSDSIAERLRRFREDRIRIIQGGDDPLPLQRGVRMILHIVPLTAFVDPLDLQFHHSQHQGIIMPFGAGGFDYQYTLDGYITYSGMGNSSEAVRAYTLMFRTGAVEMAASIPGGVDNNGKRLLHLTGIEGFVAQGWQRYTMFAKFFGIEAPFYVFLSMLNIKGFEPEASFFISPSPVPSRRDSILFPEVELASDRLAQGPGVIFARLFDTLANAFGLERSSNPAIPRH
jgi:hypothetical protein